LLREDDMPNIGTVELLIVLAIVLLLFYPKSIEKFAKKAGEAVRGIREASEEVTGAIETVAEEPPLLVFVSSVIEELLHERQVVQKAVGAIPIAKPWLFEHTPASSAPLAESYLRKVRECDIFILLVGRDISEPVREEYQTALDHDKPRLVFLKDMKRGPEVEAFIEQIDVKWAKFSSDTELRQAVQEALADELIRGYREFRLSKEQVLALVGFTEELRQWSAERGTASLRRVFSDTEGRAEAPLDKRQSPPTIATQDSTQISTSFVWPTEGRLTQPYYPGHRAIDIGALRGTPVVAADSGQIVAIGEPPKEPLGICVTIDHGSGFQSRYGHLDCVFVRPGDRVRRSQMIGLVGETVGQGGGVTGPNLHFVMCKGGVPCNPLDYLPREGPRPWKTM
jgi:murein DD-endopeptidase MepM/ murein hydrolase activator NlpD